MSNNEIQYKQISQEDNIKLNFDIFIGSKIITENYDFIINENNNYEFRKLYYTQSLLSLFNEGLLNSVDHVLRTNLINKNIKEKCNIIKVDINRNNNKITFFNNGLGISKDDLKLIFSNLNSSSNYDGRTYSSGKNGIGAKIIKILSKTFKVSSVKNNNYSSLLFNNNNLIEEKNHNINDNDYTQLEYIIDFDYFEENKYEDDLIDVFIKRVYDIALFLNYINKVLNINAKIYLNDELIDINLHTLTSNLEGYLINEFLYIGINDSDNYNSNSIINGTNIQNGTSIMFYKKLLYSLIKEKCKTITQKMINDKTFVINFNLISKPEFDSNLKNSLKSEFKDFNLDKKMLKPLVEYLIEYFNSNKEKKTISKITLKDILTYENLVDAKYAGHNKHSQNCHLIITEGMSARGNCLKGIEELDENERNFYGVFSIVGKPKNLIKYSHEELLEKDIEFKLKKVIGIDCKNDKLRYGKIILMTDTDVDGYHIRAILINFFNQLKKIFLEGNILILKTPLISFKGLKNIYYDFYTMEEYNKFKEENNNIKINNVTYYKGIGTLKKEDIKRIFFKLENNLCYININTESKLNNEIEFFDEDNNKIILSNQEKVDILLNQMFGKITKERKNWINRINQLSNIESNEKYYSVYDYLSGTILIYADELNIRHIPIIYDGLKEVHRKILYIALQNPNKQFKVSELSSLVSSETDYHHGEMSMNEAIINLSQCDIPGKGTLNLIFIDGNIGSRRNYGKDHAKPRYLFSKLNTITKYLFLNKQEKLYDYKLDERGKKIEPKILYPLIPLCVVYGFSGIGYGYASKIFLYNLYSIIDYLTGKSNTITIEYIGFNGNINIQENNNKIKISGLYKIIKKNYIKITEIPFDISGTSFSKHLANLKLYDTENIIKSFHINKMENSVDIDIYLNKSIDDIELKNYNNSIDEYIISKFKLTSIITQNLTFLDLDGSIKEFDNILDYLNCFKNNILINIKRLINILLKEYRYELVIIENKIKYITYIKEKKIILNEKFSLQNFINTLIKYNFDKINNTYDYLLDIKISNLTEEKINELNNEHKILLDKIDKLINTTPELYYYEELNILRNELNNHFKKYNESKSKK